MRYWQARSVKLPNARAFLPRVPNPLRVEGLFRFEYGIDAFSGNDLLTLECKNERGILPVENDHIDLITEGAFAINHMSGSGFIPAGQIGLQEVEPYAFARISHAGCVTK